MLILDGHSSHYSLEFLEFAIKHNIVVLGYPPHCTHALQGLDVVCFAIAKMNWKIAIEKFEDEYLRGLNKDDFTFIFGGVFLLSFMETSILKAFEVTGIHPFNRNAIKAVQLEPSKVASTKVAFELPLPTPARRIVNLMMELPSPPQSPTKGKARNVESSSSLSKAREELLNSLQSSSSGSFLISDERIQSTQDIFEPVISQDKAALTPNWTHADMPITCLNSLSMDELRQKSEELVQNLQIAHQQLLYAQHIIEATNAQLVIQHLHALKLKVALGEKEKRKTKERTKIFDDGLGKVFTAGDVFNFILKRDQAKKEHAKKLAKNAEKRAQ